MDDKSHTHVIFSPLGLKDFINNNAKCIVQWIFLIENKNKIKNTHGGRGGGDDYTSIAPT